MSFVKIQSGQTNEIQWSPLSMLSLEMHLPWAPQFSTPVLSPWLWNISWYIDCKQASCWAETDGVVLWQIKWNPKDMKSKLSPSFTLSTPLESKRPTLPSAQLSPAWITGSDKVSQDFSVGISQRTSETHTFSEAELPQPSRDMIGWIWKWLIFGLDVCATFCPGIKWEPNNLITTCRYVQAH